MVIVDPEDRARLVNARQRPRHEGVDFAIGRIVIGRDSDEIDTRMQCRPKSRISETLVVAEVVLDWRGDADDRPNAEGLDTFIKPETFIKRVSRPARTAHISAETDPD